MRRANGEGRECLYLRHANPANSPRRHTPHEKYDWRASARQLTGQTASENARYCALARSRSIASSKPCRKLGSAFSAKVSAFFKSSAAVALAPLLVKFAASST